MRSGNETDGLGFRERGIVISGENRSKRGVILESVLRFEKILIRYLSFLQFLGDIVRVSLSGSNREAAEKVSEDWDWGGGGGGHGAVAEDEGRAERHENKGTNLGTSKLKSLFSTERESRTRSLIEF